MKTIYNTMKLAVLALFVTSFISCSDEIEKHDSDFIVYEDGEQFTFYGVDDTEYKTTVTMETPNHAVLDIENIGILHVETGGSYISHWMESGIDKSSKYGFREDIKTGTPSGFSDFSQYASTKEIGPITYDDVATAFVYADTIRYNVHSKRGRGVVGITDFDGFGEDTFYCVR